ASCFLVRASYILRHRTIEVRILEGNWAGGRARRRDDEDRIGLGRLDAKDPPMRLSEPAIPLSGGLLWVYRSLREGRLTARVENVGHADRLSCVVRAGYQPAPHVATSPHCVGRRPMGDRIGSLTLLALVFATALNAHIGSPDVFYEGAAGPHR